LPSAIGDFEENGAVAFLDPPRLDEKEIGGELNLARRVSRRLRHVGHDAVGEQRRIDREEDLARQLLVWASGAEHLSIGDIGAGAHLDADDLRGERYSN